MCWIVQFVRIVLLFLPHYLKLWDMTNEEKEKRRKLDIRYRAYAALFLFIIFLLSASISLLIPVHPAIRLFGMYGGIISAIFIKDVARGCYLLIKDDIFNGDLS